MTTDQVTRGKQNSIQIGLQLIIALLLAALVGLSRWTLIELTNHGKEITENRVRISDHVSNGPYYTVQQAREDGSVLLRVLEDNGKTLQEVDNRLRIVEIQQASMEGAIRNTQ